MRKYIDAAKIVGRKNLDGRLVVKSTAGLPFLLEEGMDAWIVPPQTDVPRSAVVEDIWDESSDSQVVLLSRINDASMADSVIGCHLLVAEDYVGVDISEYAVAAGSASLEGWGFVDETSGLTGEVLQVDEMPNQVLLTVRVDGREGTTLVPLVDEFLSSSDEMGKKLVLTLPNGIFEI